MLSKLLSSISSNRSTQRRALQYRDLIRKEAAIGGELFGAVPKNGRREFFCLDEHTWVWHEEWVDAHGQHHAITTRYDVRPHGIFKAQDGQPYQPLSREEARNLRQAARLYYKRVRVAVYGLPE